MDHPRGKMSYIRARSSNRPGFTFLEIVVAMAVGGMLFVGLGTLLQMFGKSLKQSKELGDYTVLKGIISRQLKKMDGGNCLQYLQLGATPPSMSSPIPLTFMKTPTIVPSGSPIPEDAILFKADGSTRINGDQYSILLTTVDPACFDDYRNSCRGTLTLEVKRTEKSSWGSSGMVRSQPVTEFLFNINAAHTQIVGCNQINTPIPGEVWVDSSRGCRYPPVFKSPTPPEGGDLELKACPTGTALVGVCVEGMEPSPMPSPPPSPTPAPAQIYTPRFCKSTDKSRVTQLGCCPLVDPDQVKSQVWRNSSCDRDASEIITGVCGSNPNPDPYPAEYSGTDQFPRGNTGRCPNNVQCSVLKNTKNKTISYMDKFCYDLRLQGGEMTSCDYREVMVEFQDSVVRPGYPHIKCCPIAAPQ